MAYYGVELFGIGLVLASLAVGNTESFGTFGVVYRPNAALAIIGMLVALVGLAVDPVAGRLFAGRAAEPTAPTTR